MSRTATEDNVLAALDSRPATAFRWQLTLPSTLGGFLFGYDTSNIGSALNFIPHPLNGFAQGYEHASTETREG